MRLLPIVFVIAAALLQGTPAQPRPWQLRWSDEFNAANGSAPDPRKWTMVTGGGGWGNRELETYTDRRSNVEQRDGNLVITARVEQLRGADGQTVHYTSARLQTLGHFTQRYGRMEARMKLPLGKGVWPAFWMLGAAVDKAGWPAAGEIDIMENIGQPRVTYSTLHGPGYSGEHGLSAHLELPAADSVDAAFHLFSVEWERNELRFYVDDTLVVRRTPADLPSGATWVYDKPFFLLLNLAIGGAWPGNPDESTHFPQRLLVDYVRVYTRD